MTPRFLYNDPHFKNLRKTLRNAHIPGEYELWKYLRQRRMLCFKFRRQYGIGPYVLDFFCPELRLCIEVDGATHSQPIELRYDQRRQEFVEKYDIQVIQVLGTDVQENIDGVVQFLTTKIQARANEMSASTTSCPPSRNKFGTCSASGGGMCS